MAGKVTAGPAESNGSLLSSGCLKVTCGLTVHRDQLWAQHSVTSMGDLYFFIAISIAVTVILQYQQLQ